MFQRYDCEDFANLLCLTTQDYKYRPFIEIQQSVASICEIMPDSRPDSHLWFDSAGFCVGTRHGPALSSCTSMGKALRR